MEIYCDALQASIGCVGFVFKAVEYPPIHSVVQNGTRLATAGFRGVSLRLSRIRQARHKKPPQAVKRAAV
jgi:hypothetical protein